MTATLGSGDSDVFSFDANTGRTTKYQFNVNGQSDTGTLTWNANGSLNQLAITDALSSADSQTCTYAHDDLSRIASVNCGSSTWQQNFGYDAFGNITKTVPTGGTGNSFQPTYNSATNHFSSIPGTTVSYDAAGNVLADGSHTYSWDAYGKATTIDSVSLTYDAFGRMIEQNRSGAYTEIVYSPAGGKLALMMGQTLQKGLIPLPSGGQAVYSSSGLLYYGHSDHLGSMRLGSTPSRALEFDLAHAPFGEIYASSGTLHPAFTGQRQDTVTGLYDFPAREYSIQGRWPSPDPAGLAAVDPSNPQSWNRYAYVLNNPLALVDPLGLNDCPDNKATCGDDPGQDTGASGVDLFGGFGGPFFGPGNPANGCDLGDITNCADQEDNRQIAANIRALNLAGFTALAAINGAMADYNQSIIDSEVRAAQSRGEQFIIVSCTGSLDSIMCFPLGLYAALLAPGQSPYSTGLSPYNKYFIRKIINSTGADQRAEGLGNQLIYLFDHPMTGCEYGAFIAFSGATLAFPYGGPLAGTAAGRTISATSYLFASAKVLGAACK
jgi:RHS repeat-associated protein